MGELLTKFIVGAPPESWRDVHVAVALSGGPDSVALLRAAVELKRHAGGKGELVALHVNHQLRGAESDGDATWCADLCRRLGIPIDVSAGNVAERATAEGDGIEAAARDERYRLLTDMAEKRGARYLFLGHTRDDQVETVLFRILRGTGIRGLAGIAGSRMLTRSLTLLRPLRECSRGEVLIFLNQCGQDFRFDSSNASCVFARNRIRTELLPLLRESYSAGVDEAVLRLAEQAGEVQLFVEAQATKLLEKARERSHLGGFVINLKRLRDNLLGGQTTARQASSSPPERDSAFLVSEVLRLAWRDAELPEQAMTREWWIELARLTAQGASDVVWNLPGSVRVELAQEILAVERRPLA